MNHTVESLKKLGFRVTVNYKRYFTKSIEKMLGTLCDNKGNKVTEFCKSPENYTILCDVSRTGQRKVSNITNATGLTVKANGGETSVTLEKDGRSATYTSICNNNDRFEKKVGRTIALNRAFKNFILQD